MFPGPLPVLQGGFHVTICRPLHEGRAGRERPRTRNLSELARDRRFERGAGHGGGQAEILPATVAVRLVAACRPDPDRGGRFSFLNYWPYKEQCPTSRARKRETARALAAAAANPAKTNTKRKAKGEARGKVTPD